MDFQTRHETLIKILELGQVDAISLMRQVDSSVNWHEYSNYLDQLHTKGILKVAGHTDAGLELYRLSR